MCGLAVLCSKLLICTKPGICRAWTMIVTSSNVPGPGSLSALVTWVLAWKQFLWLVCGAEITKSPRRAPSQIWYSSLQVIQPFFASVPLWEVRIPVSHWMLDWEMLHRCNITFLCTLGLSSVIFDPHFSICFCKTSSLQLVLFFFIFVHTMILLFNDVWQEDKCILLLLGSLVYVQIPSTRFLSLCLYLHYTGWHLNTVQFKHVSEYFWE